MSGRSDSGNPLHISENNQARKLKFDVLVQDSDCGNFALQASGAISPNATSDFRLLSKKSESVAASV